MGWRVVRLGRLHASRDLAVPLRSLQQRQLASKASIPLFDIFKVYSKGQRALERALDPWFQSYLTSESGKRAGARCRLRAQLLNFSSAQGLTFLLFHFKLCQL